LSIIPRFLSYVKGTSVVHRLDPRTKIVFILSSIIYISLSDSFEVLLPLTFFSLLFYVSARIPLKEASRTWKFLLLVILVFSGFNLVFLTLLEHEESPPVIEFYGIQITERILYRAILPLLKLLTLGITTLTVVFTTDPSRFAPAIAKLGLPYKLTYVVDLAFRYIPIFFKEMETTLHAQMARGYKPKGGRNPVSRILSIVPLIVPVSINATLSIYDIADSMALRAFGSRKKHTWYRTLELQGRDYIIIAFSIFLLSFILLYKFGILNI